jgi:hypothetical protein
MSGCNQEERGKKRPVQTLGGECGGTGCGNLRTPNLTWNGAELPGCGDHSGHKSGAGSTLNPLWAREERFRCFRWGL